MYPPWSLMMNSAPIDLYLDSNWQCWPFSSTSPALIEFDWITSFAFSSGFQATATEAIAFNHNSNFGSSFLVTAQEVAWPFVWWYLFDLDLLHFELNRRCLGILQSLCVDLRPNGCCWSSFGVWSRLSNRDLATRLGAPGFCLGCLASSLLLLLVCSGWRRTGWAWARSPGRSRFRPRDRRCATNSPHSMNSWISKGLADGFCYHWSRLTAFQIDWTHLEFLCPRNSGSLNSASAAPN